MPEKLDGVEKVSALEKGRQTRGNSCAWNPFFIKKISNCRGGILKVTGTCDWGSQGVYVNESRSFKNYKTNLFGALSFIKRKSDGQYALSLYVDDKVYIEAWRSLNLCRSSSFPGVFIGDVKLVKRRQRCARK